MGRRVWVAVAIAGVLLPGFSGCLGFGGSKDLVEQEPRPETDFVADRVQEGLARVGRLLENPLVLPVDLTIHVVFVGLDLSLVDTTAIKQGLPADYSPEILFGRQRGAGLRSGLVANLDYEFHQAPDAFAKGLFEFYPEISRDVSIRDHGALVPAFLTRYDAMYNWGRAASDVVHVVDAQKVERWIENHREEAGLTFDGPQYTVFFLDSYTRYGLWADSYYWYEFSNEADTNPDAVNMRAWGGTYDFFFMDYSAAPNDALFDNVGVSNVDPFGPGVTPVPVMAPEGTAYNDPPIWHYKGNQATIGVGALQKTVSLGDRVRHALDVAINLRILGDYAPPPIYAEHYHINVHLWHDGRSQMPQDRLAQTFDTARLFRGLQAEVPWALVTGSLTTYVAPRDDPGMALVLDQAKAMGGTTYVPTAPISNYIDANRDKYTQDVPGALQVMALLFLFEGHYSFALPVIVGGISLTSADGLGWGTMSSVSDYQYLLGGRDMGRMAENLVNINAHEIGHYFGLYHAHDGYRRTETGYGPFSDHTWSSTNTVMSYRLRPETSDRFHVDHLARAHTLQNLERTLRNTESVYRALDAQGIQQTPAEVAAALDATSHGYSEAVSAHREGRFQPAVRAAIDGRRASEEALERSGVTERRTLALAWSNQGVQSAGAKAPAAFLEAALLPSGPFTDYKPLVIDRDVENVTVRVEWNNSPSSWGDFFAGWRFDGMREPISISPAVSHHVNLGAGVHDAREEKPTDGNAAEEFTLDMDSFPGFRDGTTVYVGAGSRGMAVNGAYKVEVRVVHRYHGDGTDLQSQPSA